jgi:hypothetical protein
MSLPILDKRVLVTSEHMRGCGLWFFVTNPMHRFIDRRPQSPQKHRYLVVVLILGRQLFLPRCLCEHDVSTTATCSDAVM